jgi:hypothetical protein
MCQCGHLLEDHHDGWERCTKCSCQKFIDAEILALGELHDLTGDMSNAGRIDAILRRSKEISRRANRVSPRPLDPSELRQRLARHVGENIKFLGGLALAFLALSIVLLLFDAGHPVIAILLAAVFFGLACWLHWVFHYGMGDE